MTLVPIIYTSLLIFSALLLFVIITSYISFKLKPQKKFVTEHVEPARQININRIHNYQNPAPILIKNYNPNRVIKENLLNKSNIRNTTSIIEKKFTPKTIQRNTKRLEVMNKREIFQNIENSYQPSLIFEQPNSFKSKNFRITDANILDFYSDNSIKNYSSFSAI